MDSLLTSYENNTKFEVYEDMDYPFDETAFEVVKYKQVNGAWKQVDCVAGIDTNSARGALEFYLSTYN